MRWQFCLIILGALALQRVTHAHDYWIELSNYEAERGEIVAASLRVGMAFEGEPRPRNAKHIKRFWMRDASDEHEIRGQDGGDPAGFIRAEESGTTIVAYRSNQSTIELEAAKFNAYLEEEGLDHVLALRTSRYEMDEVGRETYSRCAKSILTVGEPMEEGIDEPIGLTLELVPLKHPAMLDESRTFPVKLLHEGEPLADAKVRAMHRSIDSAKATVLEARTDENGRAEFELPSDGVWLLATVHMFEVGDDPSLDWESLWASLTMEVRLQERAQDDPSTPRFDASFFGQYSRSTGGPYCVPKIRSPASPSPGRM